MEIRGQVIDKGHYGQTTLSPVGALVLFPLLAAVLMLSRRAAVAAFIAAVCFISDGQRINIAGADFTPIRMLIAVGALRVLMRAEYAHLRWRLIDTLFVSYVVSGFGAYTLLYEFDPSAIVRRSGRLIFLHLRPVRLWDELLV